MDIEILLILQQFREGAGSCLLDFMQKMTYFGEMNTVLIISGIIYWCISKKFGSYLLMGWTFNRVLNGFLKVTACVYRPWLRDSRILPNSEAMASATGYSFPSGHSMNGASLFGGSAIRKELNKALRIVLFITVLLVAFSRIYLGVHTPQDISVGVVIGLFVMWLTTKLMYWIDKHPKKDIVVLYVGVLIAAIVAVYAVLKSYPEHYDELGNLLVDGSKMAKDTFKGVGWCIGFLVGWVLERRYINFSTDVSMMTRMTRLVIGLQGYYVINLILNHQLKILLPSVAAPLLTCFIQMFYVSFLFPLCMRFLDDETPRR